MKYIVKYRLGNRHFRSTVEASNPATAEYLIRGKIEIISIDPEIGDNGIFESLKSIFK